MQYFAYDIVAHLSNRVHSADDRQEGEQPRRSPADGVTQVVVICPARVFRFYYVICASVNWYTYVRTGSDSLSRPLTDNYVCYSRKTYHHHHLLLRSFYVLHHCPYFATQWLSLTTLTSQKWTRHHLAQVQSDYCASKFRLWHHHSSTLHLCIRRLPKISDRGRSPTLLINHFSYQTVYHATDITPIPLVIREWTIGLVHFSLYSWRSSQPHFLLLPYSYQALWPSPVGFLFSPGKHIQDTHWSFIESSL